MYAKDEILNSMSEEDMFLFLNMMDNKELLKMLHNLPNELFIEIYKKYRDKKGHQLTKSL